MKPTNLRRRNFLKGAFGVTLGLPFLESLYASEAAAQEVDHRFAVFIRQPSGVIRESYWPANPGPLTADMLKDTSLAPIIPALSQMLLIRGLEFRNASAGNGCHHATGMAQMFTGTAEIRTDAAQNNVRARGESLDNRIAREFKHAPLCLHAHGNGSSRYITSAKINGEMQNSVYLKPYAAYSSMFSMNQTPNGDEARALLRKSAVDYVREEMQALMKDPRLASADKQRLNDHFALVREVEVKMAKITPEKLKELQNKGNDEKAKSNNSSMNAIIKLHMDVITLAIASGSRRAANLQIGDIINGITYTTDWKEQHQNSHHAQNDPTKIPFQVRYDRLHTEFFKYLVDQLNLYKIGNKTLLDHGVVVMASELGDGRYHNLNDIPYLIAGSLNGYLKQGHYVKLAKTKNTKFLNAIGAGMGLQNAAKTGPLDDFGDTSGGDIYTGQLTEILT